MAIGDTPTISCRRWLVKLTCRVRSTWNTTIWHAPTTASNDCDLTGRASSTLACSAETLSSSLNDDRVGRPLEPVGRIDPLPGPLAFWYRPRQTPTSPGEVIISIQAATALGRSSGWMNSVEGRPTGCSGRQPSKSPRSLVHRRDDAHGVAGHMDGDPRLVFSPSEPIAPNRFLRLRPKPHSLMRHIRPLYQYILVLLVPKLKWAPDPRHREIGSIQKWPNVLRGPTAGRRARGC